MSNQVTYPPEELSDVTILLDDKHKFRLHKTILAQHSSIFRDAFAQDQQCKEIDVSGRSFHTFEQLRVFFDLVYAISAASDVELPVERVRLVLPLADFYNAAQLRKLCIAALETKSLSPFEDLVLASKCKGLQTLQLKLIEKICGDPCAAQRQIPPERRTAVYAQLPGDVWGQMFERLLETGISVKDCAGANIKVGMTLVVQDTAAKWLPATVLEVSKDENSIKVSFVGWSAKWDEWIARNSDRIAPPGKLAGVTETSTNSNNANQILPDNANK